MGPGWTFPWAAKVEHESDVEVTKTTQDQLIVIEQNPDRCCGEKVAEGWHAEKVPQTCYAENVPNCCYVEEVRGEEELKEMGRGEL